MDNNERAPEVVVFIEVVVVVLVEVVVVVVVVVVAEAVVVLSVVGGSSHLEFLSKHRALPFASRALVGAQGITFSHAVFFPVGRFLLNSWPASV